MSPSPFHKTQKVPGTFWNSKRYQGPSAFRNQRGQIIVLIALSITALLLMTGVALDGGRLYYYWTGLSRAVDAACSAAARNGTVAEIPGIATDVGQFNMAQQGVNFGTISINGRLTAGGNRYRSVQVDGTLTGIRSMIMQLAGQNSSGVAAQANCQACIPDAPGALPVPTVAGFYQGGLACQDICNDNTGACCAFYHTWNPFTGAANCLCGLNPAVAANTDNCNPNSGASVGVNPGDPYPGLFDPANGSFPSAWIARSDEDNLQEACGISCRVNGLQFGNLWCNEGCAGRNDKVCCKCWCANTAC